MCESIKIRMRLPTFIFYIVQCLYWLISFTCARDVPCDIENNYWIPPHHECTTLNAVCRPTITYTTNFNAQQDAMNIYEDLKKRNNETLINILTRRTAIERYLIGSSFVENNRRHQKTLRNYMESYAHISTDLKEMVDGLMMAPNCFHRRHCRKAFQANSFKHEFLMDILGVLSNSGNIHLWPSSNSSSVNQNLKWMIGRYGSHLSLRAKNFFKNMDMKVETEFPIDEDDVATDAGILIEAAKTEQDLTVHDPFTSIFLNNNNNYLRNVYRIFKDTMNETIGDNLSGRIHPENDMYLIYTMYYKVTNDRSEYLAERLYDSLTKLHNSNYGTDTLNKILISRAEIDLVNIKNAFRDKYKYSLETMIKENFEEGEYKEACLRILQDQETESNQDESSWTNYVKLYTENTIICEDRNDEFELYIQMETPSKSRQGGCFPIFCSRNIN